MHEVKNFKATKSLNLTFQKTAHNTQRKSGAMGKIDWQSSIWGFQFFLELKYIDQLLSKCFTMRALIKNFKIFIRGFVVTSILDRPTISNTAMRKT